MKSFSLFWYWNWLRDKGSWQKDSWCNNYYSRNGIAQASTVVTKLLFIINRQMDFGEPIFQRKVLASWKLHKVQDCYRYIEYELVFSGHREIALPFTTITSCLSIREWIPKRKFWHNSTTTLHYNTSIGLLPSFNYVFKNIESCPKL